MIEIREVLRRHASEQSLRRIARETGLDRKTVRRYIEAAEQAQADVSDGGVQEVAHRVQARPLPTIRGMMASGSSRGAGV